MSVVSAESLFDYLYKHVPFSNTTGAVDNTESNNKLVVLFTSKEGSGPGKKSPLALQSPNSYIKSAIFFDLDGEFSDSKSPISTTMLPYEEFAKKLARLGISNEHHIVVYDDYGNFYASRVWFMLKSIGHRNVSVLDGGLHRWLLLKYPVENRCTGESESSAYIAKPTLNFRFVDKAFVSHIVDKRPESVTILDARSLARFSGNEKETRTNLRSGHIPSSQSLHYASLQKDDFTFLSPQQLSSFFAPYQGQSLVFTCGSGVTACILAQAAYIVGFTRLSVYDGSWSEWGSDVSLPIEADAN